MIKLERGKSVFWCETPEQAVQLHRLLQDEHAAAPAARPSSLTGQKRGARVNGHSPAHEFLRKLSEHEGQEIIAPDMVKLTGANHVNGIGAKLKRYRKELAAAPNPIRLDDYLSSKRNATGATTWTVIRQVQA